MDGLVRLMPAWQIDIPIGDGYVIPPLFWPAVVGLGALTTVPMFYPFIEARRLKDKKSHHLLQRPRDNPERTGLGAMAFTFFIVATISGGNDVIADKFHISLNAMTWAVRICLGLQQHDREVLAHGVETGIIKRAPDGRFYEVHQPLGPVDDHGHPLPLDYAGWVVPKKMNRLGALAPAVKGFFFPVEKPAEAPVSPGMPPVTAREEREEITSGR
jgi:ubiquinol-cytochrome c reductase cytochrome b subunit